MYEDLLTTGQRRLLACEHCNIINSSIPFGPSRIFAVHSTGRFKFQPLNPQTPKPLNP